ncbi:MAG: hypothetical protein ACFB4J_19025 [Elainellaceae cyanobacterium]
MHIAICFDGLTHRSVERTQQWSSVLTDKVNKNSGHDETGPATKQIEAIAQAHANRVISKERFPSILEELTRRSP